MVKRYGDEVVREIGERLAFENSIKVQQYVADSTANLIRNVNETTKKRIRRQMGVAFDNQETVAQIRDRIESVFVEASGYRARNIAVTESTRLTGFASDEAISQSGVQFKEWLATLDGSTRDAHSRMDGQVVTRGGKFVALGGATADHPGDFGIARLDINCRCAVVAAFPEKSARTEIERRAAWDAREKRRKRHEKEILELFQKFFTMQKEAVMQKVTDIAGE